MNKFQFHYIAIEKYLDFEYTWRFNAIKLADDSPPEDMKELVWQAEYYRNGLVQYKILHDPVLNVLIPRLCLLTGYDIRKISKKHGEYFSPLEV